MEWQNWARTYEQSPIILVGGLAGDNGQMPIAELLTNSGPSNYDLSDSIKFRTMSGGSLIKVEAATFPLNNQAVASNAVIIDQIGVQVEMVFPANADIGLVTKQKVMTALQSQLMQHIAAGGWFNVLTPSFIYTNCILAELTDESDADMGSQPQNRWIWVFIQSLLSADSLASAQNPMMNSITSQTYDAGNPNSASVQNSAESGNNPSISPSNVANPANNIVAQQASPTQQISSTVAPIKPGILV